MDKNMKIEDMPILLRREVEALILKPFLEAFEKEVGTERTLEIVCQIMREKAGEQGRALAARHGVDSLEDVALLSKGIMDFLENRGVDRRTSSIVGL